MIELFLQTAPSYGDAAAAGGFMAMLAGIGIAMALIGLAVYIYFALVLMKIAKKVDQEPAWLAFIPIANYWLLSQMADMHWWPILLILIGWIPIIGQLAMLALSVFIIVWFWKVMEKIGRPGWWAILLIIPIVNLVIIGMAAWGEAK